MIKTISILGCGWLGLPLGKQLTEEGYQVKGSVTSRVGMVELSRAGIQPYRILLKPEQASVSDKSFFETDVLIIAIPPRRINLIEAVFPEQIRQLIPYIKTFHIPRVIFISSTSVYNENFQVVREEDALLPEKPSGKAMLITENMLHENSSFKTTVLRFGGLIGADRNPARFLTRKNEQLSGLKPINLIHQDDCIAIISRIIKDDVWGETFNACSPEHPTRKEFYEKASEISGLPLPIMTEQITSYKVVDSSKLIDRLKYQFKFRSPIDYLVHKSENVEP